MAAQSVEVRACDVDELFRLFTLPPADFQTQYLILDVRDHKHFKKNHISQSFCVRLSSNGKILAEYSKATYKTRWSTDVWVGRTVYMYGDPGLSKKHPAVAFLASSGCKAVVCLKEGFDGFLATYPYVCTSSVSAASKHYPSQILAGELYLGDWNHAIDVERLKELNIRALVTIHNNPENMRPHLPKDTKWLSWELADVETADIAACFNCTYEFIEEARAKKQGVTG